MGEFSDVITLLESSYFQQALGNEEESKNQCLQAIKLLNKLGKSQDLQDQGHREIIHAISKFTLQLYDTMTTTAMSSDDKIIWLNSKVHQTFMFPQLKFSDKLNSCNRRFISYQQQPKLILPDIKANYQAITNSDWSITNLDRDLTNLYQDMLSNCSFVSSFLSLVHSGNASKLYDIITPHGPSERYNVELRFNGAIRKVTVDNTLPILDDNSRKLTICSSTNETLYWPALIEKAYLTLMGQGYNFEGSNMAADTYILTGWIPEIIKIKDGRLPTKNLSLCQQYGHLTSLGIGTGKISKKLSDQIGLISNHDYVLLRDITQDNLLIKNPWLENEDTRKIMETGKNELFHFNYLYVNWNIEKIFQFKHCNNFIYNDKINLGISGKPQYGVSNPTNEVQNVWIFLERYISKQATAMISMDLYDSEFGDKIILHDQYNNIFSSDPTNSHFDLIRISMEPKSSYTLLINCSITTSMSLTIFNNISPQLKLTKSKIKYENLVEFNDEWDFNNCGGNSSYATYLNNPQFDVEITQSSDILIILESNQLITFQMFYWNEFDKNKGMRMFKNGDLLIDLPYKRAIQSSNLKRVEPGWYRIICSCNEPNIKDKFKLKIYHRGLNDSLKLSKVIGTLGLFTNNYRFDWNGENRHKINFQLSNFNNTLTFHLQFSSNNFTSPEKIVNYRPSLRASLFNLDNSKPVMVNNEWDNSIYGVFMDCHVKHPGNYVLLVERFEPGIGGLEVDIGCNNHFDIF